MVGSRRALVGWTASAAPAPAAAALALSPAPEAFAAKSSIRLRGPKVNTLGARFQYTVSGIAAGRANHLYVWEAPSTPACALTSSAQARRATLALYDPAPRDATSLTLAKQASPERRTRHSRLGHGRSTSGVH